MFTEKMIKEAFQAICELYNDEDCWMLDEDFLWWKAFQINVWKRH